MNVFIILNHLISDNKWFKIFLQYTQRFWIHEESVSKNLVLMIIPRRSHHAMKHSILSAWTAMDGCWNLSDMEGRWLPMYSLNTELSNQHIKDITDIIHSDPFRSIQCT